MTFRQKSLHSPRNTCANSVSGDNAEVGGGGGDGLENMVYLLSLLLRNVVCTFVCVVVFGEKLVCSNAFCLWET